MIQGRNINLAGMHYPAFLRKIFNPPEFQGNLKKRDYFEGWYLKHDSHDLIHSISFIPGISLSKDPHSFIQILNGLTGESFYIRYDLKQFSYDPGKFGVRIGNSYFSEQYSDINILSENINASGKIDYKNTIPYPVTLISPGIMGWYSYVPFLECKHGVVSVIHDISGVLELNGQFIDFTNGKGYIEKDWGTSFPESWIWFQCNHFNKKDASFLLSVAKIPWLSRYFIGFLGFLYDGARFYNFATYNHSYLTKLEKTADLFEVSIHNKDFTIDAFIRINQYGYLKAPKLGIMERFMKESVNSDLEIILKDRKGITVLRLEGRRAGVEITGNLETLREGVVRKA
jgi:tocopherol cyclase